MVADLNKIFEMNQWGFLEEFYFNFPVNPAL